MKKYRVGWDKTFKRHLLAIKIVNSELKAALEGFERLSDFMLGRLDWRDVSGLFGYKMIKIVPKNLNRSPKIKWVKEYVDAKIL